MISYSYSIIAIEEIMANLELKGRPRENSHRLTKLVMIEQWSVE